MDSIKSGAKDFIVKPFKPYHYNLFTQIIPWIYLVVILLRLKEIKAMDPGATVVMCSAMGQETMVMDHSAFRSSPVKEAVKSGTKRSSRNFLK